MNRAPMTYLPNWVFDLYDEDILVRRIHESLLSLRLFADSKVTVYLLPRPDKEM